MVFRHVSKISVLKPQKTVQVISDSCLLHHVRCVSGLTPAKAILEDRRSTPTGSLWGRDVSKVSERVYSTHTPWKGKRWVKIPYRRHYSIKDSIMKIFGKKNIKKKSKGKVEEVTVKRRTPMEGPMADMTPMKKKPFVVAKDKNLTASPKSKGIQKKKKRNRRNRGLYDRPLEDEVISFKDLCKKIKPGPDICETLKEKICSPEEHYGVQKPKEFCKGHSDDGLKWHQRPTDEFNPCLKPWLMREPAEINPKPCKPEEPKEEPFDWDDFEPCKPIKKKKKKKKSKNKRLSCMDSICEEMMGTTEEETRVQVDGCSHSRTCPVKNDDSTQDGDVCNDFLDPWKKYEIADQKKEKKEPEDKCVDFLDPWRRYKAIAKGQCPSRQCRITITIRKCAKKRKSKKTCKKPKKKKKKKKIGGKKGKKCSSNAGSQGSQGTPIKCSSNPGSSPSCSPSNTTTTTNNCLLLTTSTSDGPNKINPSALLGYMQSNPEVTNKCFATPKNYGCAKINPKPSHLVDEDPKPFTSNATPNQEPCEEPSKPNHSPVILKPCYRLPHYYPKSKKLIPCEFSPKKSQGTDMQDPTEPYKSTRNPNNPNDSSAFDGKTTKKRMSSWTGSLMTIYETNIKPCIKGTKSTNDLLRCSGVVYDLTRDEPYGSSKATFGVGGRPNTINGGVEKLSLSVKGFWKKTSNPNGAKPGYLKEPYRPKIFTLNNANRGGIGNSYTNIRRSLKTSASLMESTQKVPKPYKSSIPIRPNSRNGERNPKCSGECLKKSICTLRAASNVAREVTVKETPKTFNSEPYKSPTVNDKVVVFKDPNKNTDGGSFVGDTTKGKSLEENPSKGSLKTPSKRTLEGPPNISQPYSEPTKPKSSAILKVGLYQNPLFTFGYIPNTNAQPSNLVYKRPFSMNLTEATLKSREPNLKVGPGGNPFFPQNEDSTNVLLTNDSKSDSTEISDGGGAKNPLTYREGFDTPMNYSWGKDPIKNIGVFAKPHCLYDAIVKPPNNTTVTYLNHLTYPPNKNSWATTKGSVVKNSLTYPGDFDCPMTYPGTFGNNYNPTKLIGVTKSKTTLFDAVFNGFYLNKYGAAVPKYDLLRGHFAKPNYRVGFDDVKRLLNGTSTVSLCDAISCISQSDVMTYHNPHNPFKHKGGSVKYLFNCCGKTPNFDHPYGNATRMGPTKEISIQTYLNLNSSYRHMHGSGRGNSENDPNIDTEPVSIDKGVILYKITLKNRQKLEKHLAGVELLKPDPKGVVTNVGNSTNVIDLEDTTNEEFGYYLENLVGANDFKCAPKKTLDEDLKHELINLEKSTTNLFKDLEYKWNLKGFGDYPRYKDPEVWVDRDLLEKRDPGSNAEHKDPLVRIEQKEPFAKEEKVDPTKTDILKDPQKILEVLAKKRKSKGRCKNKRCPVVCNLTKSCEDPNKKKEEEERLKKEACEGKKPPDCSKKGPKKEAKPCCPPPKKDCIERDFDKPSCLCPPRNLYPSQRKPCPKKRKRVCRRLRKKPEPDLLECDICKRFKTYEEPKPIMKPTTCVAVKCRKKPLKCNVPIISKKRCLKKGRRQEICVMCPKPKRDKEKCQIEPPVIMEEPIKCPQKKCGRKKRKKCVPQEDTEPPPPPPPDSCEEPNNPLREKRAKPKSYPDDKKSKKPKKKSKKKKKKAAKKRKKRQKVCKGSKKGKKARLDIFDHSKHTEWVAVPIRKGCGEEEACKVDQKPKPDLPKYTRDSGFHRTPGGGGSMACPSSSTMQPPRLDKELPKMRKPKKGFTENAQEILKSICDVCKKGGKKCAGFLAFVDFSGWNVNVRAHHQELAFSEGGDHDNGDEDHGNHNSSNYVNSGNYTDGNYDTNGNYNDDNRDDDDNHRGNKEGENTTYLST